MKMASVYFKLLTLSVASALVDFAASSSTAYGFTYNGFLSANLSFDGIAGITNNGLLMLSNGTTEQTGHAFHPDPINFKNSPNSEAFSFSTTFVFAIRSESKFVSSQGIAFFIAPTKILPGGRQLGALGLFNGTNENATSHVFAVELDTFQNPDLPDINSNHVGIDIGSIDSKEQTPAGYYPNDRDKGSFKNLTLSSGKPMQVWVDYDGKKKEINVTLATLEAAGKPSIPLLNLIYDLSPVLRQTMYVGFSTASGLFTVRHYVLGWSFTVNGGAARQLNLSQLPKLPKLGSNVSQFYTIGLPLICVLSILAAILGLIYYLGRKMKFAELLDDWEMVYRPHRFKYKDLYTATKGFRETELLGSGGFGSVYRGVLASSNLQIAVKRVSHESRQGMREFVAEIVSIGRMNHRNLVPLLGYCRREGELLLVYEYMPNGSLDKILYGRTKFILNWSHRFRIIKGVASGLFYLHEGWEQVVIHRDVKSSNVLLDGEFNGRVGDFGLARLYDRGTDPQTTKVAGTLGYLAPEYYRSGRATTRTDVYAFGVFLLEVVCGKRPIHQPDPREDLLLVEWVFSYWNEGRILEAVDQNLGNDFMKDEAELALKLGLLCCNPEPKARPCMQRVMLCLDGSMPLPELSSAPPSAGTITFAIGKGFEGVPISYSSSTGKASPSNSNVEDSLLSDRR